MGVPHRKLIYGRFIILPAILAAFTAAMTAAVQLSTEYGADSLGACAAVFAAVLMLLLFTGLCLNYCFPAGRKQDFKMLSGICGVILFGVVTVTGLELRVNFMRIFNVIVDRYGIYEAADFLRSGMRPKAGDALFGIFCRDPEYYACAAFQSVLLSVFGYRGEVPACANLFLQFTGAFCAAGTARVFGGRLSALVVYALFLCLPQEAAFVVRIEGDPLYFALLMVSVFLFAVTVETEKQDRMTVVHGLLYLMDGLLFGIAFFIHPVTLVMIVSLFLFLCFLRETEERRPVVSGLRMGLVFLAGACGTFFAMLFAKAEDLKTSVSTVAFPYLECFLPDSFSRFSANFRESWNARLYPELPDGYTSGLENEITVVICLCLCFVSLVFSFAWKRKGAVPASALLAGLSWLHGCGRIRADGHLAFLAALFLAGFLLQEFYWLFCANEAERPPEQAVKEAAPGGILAGLVLQEDAAPDAEAELFVSELSDLLPGVKEEPKEREIPETEETPPKKEIHYIENPLPGPKKHVPRTLDFDIDVSDDDDFDI